MATDVGTAQGRIVIDTRDLSRVSVESQKVGKQVEQNLDRIGAGAGRAQQSITGLSDSMQQMGSIGLSFAAAALGRFTMEANVVATAYARQSVAALSLAGSQAKLNELMAAYDKATGGAVDKATAMADVTRLQAVGFADSAAELEQFVRAARGIAVAMGSQQDYVISQLQLAIANQSTMRLDQLGLGVSEVTARIDLLKAANKSMTNEMAYQQAILGLAGEKFGALADSAESSATGAERAAKSFRAVKLAWGELTGGPVGFGGDAIAGWLERTTKDAQHLRTVIVDLGQAFGLLPRSWESSWNPKDPTIGSRTAIGWEVRERSSAVTPARFSGPEGEAQLDAIRNRWTAITSIERTSGAAIVESTRQYSEQRANTIRDYEQGIAREAEDFARGRARAEAAHLRQLEDLRSSAARREASMAAELARVNSQAATDSAARVAEWTAEHGRAVADAREASSARLVKLEEDYNRDRQRAAQDSRERLLNAAGRLDAAAVVAEQRRAAQEAQRAEENHQERVESEQESLQEALDNLNETHAKRIDDEAKALARSTRQRQEAYERQLTESRAADAQREQDMIDDFAERKALEDEDRAIRLGRMAQDHSARLAEMARQHELDLAQIAANAAAERKQAEDDFNKAMEAAGVRNAAWIAKNKLLTDAAIADYDRVTAAMGRMINTLQGPLERNPYITPGAWPSLTGGSSTSASSASITIAPGAIVINATPYQSPQDIGDEVRNVFYQVLEEMR